MTPISHGESLTLQHNGVSVTITVFDRWTANFQVRGGPVHPFRDKRLRSSQEAVDEAFRRASTAIGAGTL